jgi:hypothetical protein
MCTVYVAMHVALKLQHIIFTRVYCAVYEFQTEKNYNIREGGMIVFVVSE